MNNVINMFWLRAKKRIVFNIEDLPCTESPPVYA
jgi:hypothetical protein